MLTGWITALVAVAGLLAVLGALALLMRGAGGRGRRGVVPVLAIGGAGLFLGGAAFGAPSAQGLLAASGSVAASVQVAAPATAAGAAPLAVDALARLTVKGSSPMTGYGRVADFGEPWIDVDHNGCDTRDDVLRRDLVQRIVRGCSVRSGVLHDPYTGRTIHFVRGPSTSEAVQIDHVVPLADAWRTGAQHLTRTQRIALANDPVNLFAVDGPTNTAKSDGDAATWLPHVKAFRCTYVAHQIAVKTTYRLWVVPAERAAMQRVLQRCPEQRLPVDRSGASAGSGSGSTGGSASPSGSGTASGSAAAVVHPGALCAPAGGTGRTAAGTAMRCTTTASDARARWRRAA